MEKRPLIGVGTFIIKGKDILFGLRKNAHGRGTWSLPGGHLEFGESIEACAVREIDEEIGITIRDIRIGPYTNDIFTKENKHYVTLYVIARYASGVVQLKEPHKYETWEWLEWPGLPEPLFLPLDNLLKQKFNPFEMV